MKHYLWLIILFLLFACNNVERTNPSAFTLDKENCFYTELAQDKVNKITKYTADTTSSSCGTVKQKQDYITGNYIVIDLQGNKIGNGIVH